MRRFQTKPSWSIGLTFLTLLLLVIASLAIGASGKGWSEIWQWLVTDTNQELEIIYGLRLNRTLAGLLVGSSLGIAGYLVQAITRNYLADPGILGVNTSAAVAVLVSSTFFGTAIGVPTAIWAGIGSTVGVLVLLAFHFRTRGSDLAIVLIGIAITAGLSAISNFLVLTSDQLTAFRSWVLGSVAIKESATLWVAFWPLLIGIGMLIFLIKSIELLAFGDAQAASLGLDVNRAVFALAVVVALLGAGATALAGPLLFVGLAAPNLAKYFAGARVRLGLLLSATIGSALILVADVLSRVLIRPAELPLGVVISLLGALTMLELMRRAREAA